MIVGLAGKACAGKDTLLPFFIDRGFVVVDADKIGHQALEANREAVLARFGTVERPALGKLVFADGRALADLEAITHPWLMAEVRRQVSGADGDVVLNAALLHKGGLFLLCHTVVWVQASLWTRILRARRRDGWSWRRILNRLWAQRKLRAQVFPPNVDILRVDNEGSPEGARKTLAVRFGSRAFPQKEDTHEKQ